MLCLRSRYGRHIWRVPVFTTKHVLGTVLSRRSLIFRRNMVTMVNSVHLKLLYWVLYGRWSSHLQKSKHCRYVRIVNINTDMDTKLFEYIQLYTFFPLTIYIEFQINTHTDLPSTDIDRISFPCRGTQFPISSKCKCVFLWTNIFSRGSWKDCHKVT